MTKGVVFKPNQREYENYYCNQAGHGLPVFVGGRHQRGRGLGSIFGGIARSLFPMIKSGAKSLLKEGARTGVQIASDVLSGQNIKSAMRQRAGESGKRLLNKAVTKLTSTPPPPPGKTRSIKRAGNGKTSHKNPKRRRRVDDGDIFD